MLSIVGKQSIRDSIAIYLNIYLSEITHFSSSHLETIRGSILLNSLLMVILTSQLVWLEIKSLIYSSGPVCLHLIPTP